MTEAHLLAELAALVAAAEAAARADRPLDARAGFERAIALADDLGGTAAVRVRLVAGRVALLAGEGLEAEARFAAALEAAGRVAPAAAPLAAGWLAYARAGLEPARAAEADETLARALERSEDPAARRALAWLRGRLALSLDRPAAAVPLLEMAGVEGLPGPGLELARARRDAGDHGGARAIAERVAASDDPLFASAARELVATLAEARLTPDGLRRVDQLARLAAAVSAARGRDEITRAALEALAALAGAACCFLLLYDGLDRTHQAGLGADEPDELGQTLAFQALWGGEPVAVREPRSALAVPLLADGAVCGVLLAEGGRLDGRGADAALPLVAALARVVAAALGREAAEAPVRAAWAVEEQLRALVAALVGCPDALLGLGAIAREARARTGATRAIVLDGSDLEPLVACGEGADAPFSRSLAAWVHAEGRPLCLVDAAEEREATASVRDLALRTVLAAPIRREGLPLGVLYLDTPRVLAGAEDTLPLLVRLGELAGPLLTR